MSTDAYLRLITSEHRGASNFIATVALSVQGYVDLQAQAATIPELFDLNTAVGAQLDVVGEWVGVSRDVPVPLAGVYFTWGGTGPGWGSGIWKGPFDPSQGLSILDDATFRLLIRSKIAANIWDGTIPGAAAALADLFNNSTTPGTLLWIQDGLNMTMTFVLSGQDPTAVFKAILRDGLIPLRPAGVAANYVETSVPGTPVFAWGMENDYGAGWGVGAWPTPL